nr:MAG TPA: hypothetical protein [Caudoviricetes sp.]
MNPTKEERDQWRERLSSPYTCFDAAHADFTIRLLRGENMTPTKRARRSE